MIKNGELKQRTKEVFFPVGLPVLSFRFKLMLFLATLSSAMLVLILLVTIGLKGEPANQISYWYFRSEALFVLASSFLLYRAHKSWQAEDFRAYRDRLFLSVLSAFCLVVVHLSGTYFWLSEWVVSNNWLIVKQIAYGIMVIGLTTIHLCIALIFLVKTLIDAWPNATPVNGYILSLNYYALQRIRTGGILWAGAVISWYYVAMVLFW